MVRDDALKARVTTNLARFEVRGVRVEAHHHAAVAVAVVDEGGGADVEGISAPSAWSGNAALLLTRRSRALTNHPGQWALPGGRLDADETPEQTALREMAEEVGITVAADRVLGRLDDFVTRSGFVITPVVVWAGRADRISANPGEVASVHRIPVTEFLREDAPVYEPGETAERPILRMPIGRDSIAAPTAAVLYQFREVCLCGLATRVAHFDQPRFAWK